MFAPVTLQGREAELEGALSSAHSALTVLLGAHASLAGIPNHHHHHHIYTPPPMQEPVADLGKDLASARSTLTELQGAHTSLEAAHRAEVDGRLAVLGQVRLPYKRLQVCSYNSSLRHTAHTHTHL